MKEIYNAPSAEMIVFTAMEKLTTTDGSRIPFNDETPVRGIVSGGSQGIEDV